MIRRRRWTFPSPEPEPSRRWLEVPPIDLGDESHGGASSLLAAAAVVVAVYLIAGPLLSIGIAAFLAALIVIERRRTARLDRWFRRVRSLQRRLGAKIEKMLLAVTWAAAILPIAYLQRSSTQDEQRGWVLIEGRSGPDSRQFVDHRRPRPKAGPLRRLALLAGALTFLITADLALGSAYYKISETPRLEDRASLTAFADSAWALDYWREFPDTSGWKYEPYIGWLRGDLRTEHINVIDGRRQTWNSPTLAPDPVEIWFFGGSTTWGVGQRDDFTIPSAFAKQAQQSGLNVVIRNHGIGAHRLWQENLHLEHRLLQGDQPDLVIFYDGANEPTGYAAADTPTPLHSRIAAFQTQLEDARSDGQVAADLWQDRSALFGAARRLRNSVAPAAPATPTTSAVDAAVAARNFMGVYREGVAIGRDIGQRHGFETVHFWQPTLYTTPGVSGIDAWTTRGYRSRDLDWYHSVYEIARDQLPNGVVDISTSLESAPKPVFFDHTHTNELGATIVADRIFAEVEPLIREISARPTP